MNFKELLARVNLATVFECELGQPVRAGRWLTYRCPCHEDRHPSLAITPDRKRWICFGACNTHGDALDWLRERHGLDFGAACRELEKYVGITPTSAPARQPAQSPAHDDAPPKWQEGAKKLITQCETTLWSERASRVREQLHARCLTDETLRYWHVGYNPKARVIGGLWVQRGVVIPWIEQDKVWAIKVRLTDEQHELKTDAPKYGQVSGARPALYGAHTLDNHMDRVAIVAEGEFDAMLLHQYARDLVATVTVGGAGSHIGWRWLNLFWTTPHILAAHDVDSAGEKAAEWWSALSERVRRVRLPFGKDITEFAQQGGDVRAWVQFQLGGINGLPVRPSPNSLPTPALGFSTFNSPAKATGNLDGSEARHDASVNTPSHPSSTINSPLGGEQ